MTTAAQQYPLITAISSMMMITASTMKIKCVTKPYNGGHKSYLYISLLYTQFIEEHTSDVSESISKIVSKNKI